MEPLLFLQSIILSAVWKIIKNTNKAPKRIGNNMPLANNPSTNKNPM